MARAWFACFLVIILQLQVNCQGPPQMTGSYKAVGEMVSVVDGGLGQLTQVRFEESYDATSGNAVFRASVMGINVTFVENFKTNQTFRYTNESFCDLMTLEEWIETDSPPSLLHYEDSNGLVRFSIKQLFSIDPKNLDGKPEKVNFRGIPATKWRYVIKPKNPALSLAVYAFWSEPSWNTTSPEKIVPLGYIVDMSNKTDSKKIKTIEENINIFSFVPDVIDHKLFEPIQGIPCPDRISLVQFPNVNKLQSVQLYSEVIFPSDLEIKYLDTWLDTRNKLYRVDMERIRDETPAYIRGKQQIKFQSEIAVGQMQVVFRLIHDNGKTSCEVVHFDDFDLDIQNLFNFRLPTKEWHVGKIFGLNDTSYDYLGKATKRNMPCHLFQGKRKDWPHPKAKVVSLWEWCFATNLTKPIKEVIFRNGEYGLVSAEVKILESGDPDYFPPGSKMIHHFYETLPTDPAIMDATSFDIGRCFDETQKRRLQFTVNWSVTKDSLPLIENATSDLDFLQKWKAVLYRCSELNAYTLRITEVSSVVAEEKLYVKFTILAPHKDLNETIIKTPIISAFDVEKTLRDNYVKGCLNITYTPSKSIGPLKLGTVEQSLTLQIKSQITPHTEPPTTRNPGTRRTTLDFSLIWPDDDRTTPKPPGTPGTGTPGNREDTTIHPTAVIDPTKKQRKTIFEGHAPATVASVSIAMLLIGITIGSAGVFVKFNGLPDCLSKT